MRLTRSLSNASPCRFVSSCCSAKLAARCLRVTGGGLIDNGVAFARLAADYQDADKMRIEGSPSLVLNEGRQKLYGNVGFRLIDANIQGLLRAPRADDASWC
jgi:hypothetical protein